MKNMWYNILPDMGQFSDSIGSGGRGKRVEGSASLKRKFLNLNADNNRLAYAA